MVVCNSRVVYSRLEVLSRLRSSLVYMILVSICLLAAFCESFGQEIVEKELAQKLDTYIQQVMGKFEIPGMTVAVTKGRKIIYTGSFGVRDLNTKEPMKPEYLFHMASVSKPFVATAIMQLVERGKMNLDEPVVTYLPYFKLADQRYKDITIRQMLNHTSGMPDVRDYEWDKPQYDVGSAERYVRSLTDQKMIAAPGERWRYSNMAFDALGDVIAKVSGQPFEIYVKENILQPLGMTESTFLRTETTPELRTTPHVWKLKPVVSEVYPYNRRHAPSSTLNSSVIEMANWAFANLNQGELNGKRILSEKSYEVLWGPSAKVDEQSQVGLSWFLGTYRGTSTVSHGGGDTGYRSHFTLLPDMDIGVILASNYDRTPIGSIRTGVLDVLLGHQPETIKISVRVPFVKVYKREGLDAAKAYFQKLRSEEEEEYRFGDGELNTLGYYFLQENRIEEAIEIFQYNVELYPDVANTYDSLGEAYMVADQKNEAISNYERSLELDPGNTNAAEMLKKLKEK